jgi:hypothetical protein
MKFLPLTLSLMLSLLACKGSSANPACAGKKDCVVYSVGSKAEVLKAVIRIEGREFDERDLCVDRPDELPNLVVVGFFADNRGCITTGYFYKGVHWEQEEDVTKVALSDLGWGKHKATREKLAFTWAKQVTLSGVHLMKEAEGPKQFGGEVYHAPQILSREDGSVVVTAWVKFESGKSRDDHYGRIEIVFSKAGTVTSRYLKRLTVPNKD